MKGSGRSPAERRGPGSRSLAEGDRPSRPWSGERAFAGALFLLSVALLVSTLGLGGVARRVPLFVVVPLVALTALQLCRKPTRLERGRFEGTPQWPALVWILVLPLVIYLLGLPAGAGLHTLGFVRLREKESWLAAAVLATAVWIGCWTFARVLPPLSGVGGLLWGFLLP